ncbi:MAG: hypothetical protein LBI90_02080 [Treponema sp.]|jgi:hypothetical protein|nr:hypothetical protein [Treponema sp.]
MAIQPIDLQTLFTQMDKVGKAQIAQKEGLAVQQAIQAVQIQQKNEANVQSVNAAPELGEGAEKVDNEGRSRGQGSAGGEGSSAEQDGEEDGEEKEKKKPANWDPALGHRIDISG